MNCEFQHICKDCNIAYNGKDCPLCKSETDRDYAEERVRFLTGELVKMGIQYEL